MLLDGFESRQKADYDVYWLASREIAEKCRRDAEAFLAEIERAMAQGAD